MISHASRGVNVNAPVNVNTTEFSMTTQSSVNGDTPATLFGMPTCVGEPPNTASMCGMLPGSVSTIATSKRPNRSRMHVSTVDQFAADTFHAANCVVAVTIVERFVRESLLPG